MPAKLLEDLGREFRGDELSFKPYACGRPQHAMLDAAIAVRNELGLGTAVDVAEIAEVRVAAGAAIVAEQFDGAPHKRRPTQIVEAQFALPYLVAAALVHGRVGITEVADIHNAQVLEIASGMQGTDEQARLTPASLPGCVTAARRLPSSDHLSARRRTVWRSRS